MNFREGGGKGGKSEMALPRLGETENCAVETGRGKDEREDAQRIRDSLRRLTVQAEGEGKRREKWIFRGGFVSIPMERGGFFGPKWGNSIRHAMGEAGGME